MAWHVVSVPSSAKELLRKNGEADFSPVQKIGAAVRLYTTLPLMQRIVLAQEYAALYPATPGTRFPRPSARSRSSRRCA
jgi:hypothetical protein